ncbi:hypothetical protein DAPPUDRAFT_251956 [Daphnia pulex]|uniref:Uncharacterized protein n=1 Tax=Daphnia pulex TaxID=6669 RepID=E9H1B6_DAPPU|nr:hypothetical protein DAPPUDRAFT_251956 [Daphnia pulex]|eukprot:EFX74418.1 hypothetical protein DAPPUDRAFT_251956 [Daphnia pulex]
MDQSLVNTSPLFHGPNPLGKRNTTPVNLLDSVPKIPFSHFVIFVKALINQVRSEVSHNYVTHDYHCKGHLGY